MKNHIVREETCFICQSKLTVMEYEPYNADSYISVTVVNGLVINKFAVCHKCFNTAYFQFTELGWTMTVGNPWPATREAIYFMRDLQSRVTDADGWHYLKSAQDHFWKEEPREVSNVR